VPGEPEHSPAPLLPVVDPATITDARPPRHDLVSVMCAGSVYPAVEWMPARVTAWGKSGESWAVCLRWRHVDLGWFVYAPAMIKPREHGS
jgi:hypothetical protein